LRDADAACEGKAAAAAPSRTKQEHTAGCTATQGPYNRVGPTPPASGATETRTIRQDILVCLPEPLHPVSRMFLEHWLAGDLATAEFLRWFHMPNSAYLSVAECVLAVVAGA
jgi:hypothetical protein